MNIIGAAAAITPSHVIVHGCCTGCGACEGGEGCDLAEGIVRVGCPLLNGPLRFSVDDGWDGAQFEDLEGASTYIASSRVAHGRDHIRGWRVVRL